jgi:hypothetical protein
VIFSRHRRKTLISRKVKKNLLMATEFRGRKKGWMREETRERLIATLNERGKNGT